MSLAFMGVAGILISYLVNHFISMVNPFLIQFLNLYSIIVIYIALKKFNSSSILITSLSGVFEDINTFYPLGVNALKKLLLFFFVNRISKFVSIFSFFSYSILIFFSIVFELLLLILITAFFGLKSPLGEFKELLLLQPLITSFLGAPLFVLFSRIVKRE